MRAKNNENSNSSFLSRLKVFFSSPPPELDESHAATRYRVAYMTREEWQEYERAVLDSACYLYADGNGECNSAKETK